MPSTSASASEINLSRQPSLGQLRCQLSGKTILKFDRCRRSDSESVVDPNLLSPPQSIESLDTPPFKPADSDQISLSMKSQRRRRAKRHRHDMDRASTGDTEERLAGRHGARKRLASISVPDLRQSTTHQRIPSAAGQFLMRQQLQALHVAYRRDSIARSVGSKRRASLPQKARRWTMPSKAASTRVLSDCPTPAITTTIVSNHDQQELSPGVDRGLGTSRQSPSLCSQVENTSPSFSASETPAMITLRRATRKGTCSITRRTSLRPNAIISFPPPKFNRTTSTYLSSFFGLNPPPSAETNIDPMQTSVRQSSWSTGQDTIDSLRKASVTADRIQLTTNTLAAPAFTQVEFLPVSHSHAGEQELLAISARRCSTTILSGSSVHEIIWDENITSSSEGSTSAEASSHTSSTARKSKSRNDCRRQSILVEKLEAQLKKSEKGRSSPKARKASAGTTTANRYRQTKSRLGKLTGWNQGSLKEASTSQQSPCTMDLQPKLNHDISTNPPGLFAIFPDEGPLSSTSTEHVGFFPPLDESAGNSRRSSISPTHSATHASETSRHVSIEESWPRNPSAFTPPVVSEPTRSDHHRARNSHSHSSAWVRKPILHSTPHPHHHHQGGGGTTAMSMSTAIGQSTRKRRRSSEPPHRPTCTARTSSRSMPEGETSQHDEYDERTPLLRAHDERSDASAAPYVFVDAQDINHDPWRRGSGEDHTMPPRTRTMSVQDFVCRFEDLRKSSLRPHRRNQAATDGSEDCVADGGAPDTARVRVGLVRRDSPWVGSRGIGDVGPSRMEIRTGGQSANRWDGNGRRRTTAALSEVDEEEEEAEGEEGEVASLLSISTAPFDATARLDAMLPGSEEASWV